MTVYVDNAMIPYKSRNRGRVYKMNHMVAETPDELLAMAQTLGLKEEWLQAGSFPHFDVTKTKRMEALDHGAVEVTPKELVYIIRRLRETPAYQ